MKRIPGIKAGFNSASSQPTGQFTFDNLKIKHEMWYRPVGTLQLGPIVAYPVIFHH